ncbi:MAG: hypothetical protein QM775_02355 [Pirellulales bacterium]
MRRDRLANSPPPREAYDLSPAGQREFAATYELANDKRLASGTFGVDGGRIVRRIELPATIKGDCHVRIYVEGRDGFAMGSADVKVLPARRTTKTVEP